MLKFTECDTIHDHTRLAFHVCQGAFGLECKLSASRDTRDISWREMDERCALCVGHSVIHTSGMYTSVSDVSNDMRTCAYVYTYEYALGA